MLASRDIMIRSRLQTSDPGRRPRRPRVGTGLAVVASAMLFAACATRYLAPAHDARRLAPDGTAVFDERDGIQVIADPQAWTGSLDVLDELIPVWVSITNRRARAIHVSPVDIELVGHGVRARAELPLSLDPQPLRAEAPLSLDPQPLRTSVGPDPTMPDNRAAVSSDQIQVRSDESRLRDEIQKRGLRDAELDEGENASGFVYFERSSWDTGRVELRVTLRSRAGGPPVTSVKLPFSVI